MIVSPFTPLFFNSRHKTDGIECDYIQTFAPTDRILLQLIGAKGWNGKAQVVAEPNGEVVYDIVFNTWNINEETTLFFHQIALSPGYYSVYIEGIGKSDVFRCTDNADELAKTTLIQYSMRDNRQRTDAVFFINHVQYFFDFRVHGGFKDSGWSFSVENEQFTTQHADISQLYGLESTQKVFTLGESRGVPIWFGEFLNRLLICTYVYFDGVRYARKETNVPEVTQQLEGHNSFVFSQTLQQAVILDPVLEEKNQAILRRDFNSERYMVTNSNINRLIN